MLSTSASSVSYRQKGKLPSTTSKLYKGFVHDATSKISVGSIPAKLELIIYRDQSNKAFGSSEPRFKDENNDAPGPQEYDIQSIYQFGRSNSESVSKRGLGGLATQQERQVFAQKYVNSGPGPASYQNNSSFATQASSGQASFFMRNPSIQNGERLQIINPGPGEYDPKLKSKSLGMKSVFVSKSLRGQYLKKPNYPPPGTYQIEELSKPTHNGPTSSFYPTGDSLKDKSPQQQIISVLLNDKDKNGINVPGPGEYEVKFPNFNPDYVQSKELSSFVKQQKDRFGRAPGIPEKQLLGPGSYEFVGQFQKIADEATHIQGAVFMGDEERVPFGDYEKRLGPNTKIPYQMPIKKNFHLNLSRKWV